MIQIQKRLDEELFSSSNKLMRIDICMYVCMDGWMDECILLFIYRCCLGRFMLQEVNLDFGVMYDMYIYILYIMLLRIF